MPSPKGRALLDRDPADLDDEELEIQIGAATERMTQIENDLASVERVKAGLEAERADLTGKADSAKGERGNRGNNGNGNGNGNR